MIGIQYSVFSIQYSVTDEVIGDWWLAAYSNDPSDRFESSRFVIRLSLLSPLTVRIPGVVDVLPALHIHRTIA